MLTAPISQGYPSPRLANYVLSILVIAAMVSLLDRQIMVLLVGPIRADLGITDTEISLLQGLAFAIFYSVAGVPLGHLADRIHSRKWIIIVGILIWSMATIGCGLSRNFQELFLARILVGFGEACLHPCAYSLLSDYFPPSRRGRAYGLFGMGAGLGISVSLFMGTAVLSLLGTAAFVSLPGLGTLASWKVVFMIAGLPGFLVMLLLLSVPEPPRLETAPRSPSVTGAKVTAFLRENRFVIVPLFAIYGMWNMAGYGNVSWMVTSYVRTHGLTVTQAGVLAGVIVGVGTAMGSYLGGLLGDRWSARGVKGGRLRVTVWASVVGAACQPVWWLTDSIPLSVALGTVIWAAGSATVNSGPAALNDLVPNQLRGRMSAIYMLVMAVAGICLGPTSVALATDYVFRDDKALYLSMIVVITPAIALSGLGAWVMLGRYSAAVASRRAEFAAGGAS